MFSWCEWGKRHAAPARVVLHGKGGELSNQATEMIY